MTVKEYYRMCIKHEYLTGFLLVELLVSHKKTLTMHDDTSKFDYYLQDQFKAAMNTELQKLAIAFDYKIQI